MTLDIIYRTIVYEPSYYNFPWIKNIKIKFSTLFGYFVLILICCVPKLVQLRFCKVTYGFKSISDQSIKKKKDNVN